MRASNRISDPDRGVRAGYRAVLANPRVLTLRGASLRRVSAHPKALRVVPACGHTVDMGRRDGKRVTKRGHAELRLKPMSEAAANGDVRALADDVVRSWPLYQRVLFGRRSRRLMARHFEASPPAE